MTDGNTYAINKHLDEPEGHEAPQEVTTELEQAEARIEELETTLQQERSAKWKVLESPFKQRVQELEAKLKAKEKLMLDLAGDKIDLVSELAGVKGKLAADRTEVIALIRKDAENGDISHGAAQWVIDTVLAELKGQ